MNSSDLVLISELSNLRAYEAENNILFLGTNIQGIESAEILNKFQLEGKLIPSNNQMKKSGFIQIKISCSLDELKDLQEAVNEKRLLMGPHREPISFCIIPKSITM